MSIMGLMSANPQDAGPGGVEAPSTDFWDVASASFEATARNYNMMSKDMFTNFENNANAEAYRKATSRNLLTDAYDGSPNRDALYKNLPNTNNVGGPTPIMAAAGATKEEQTAAVDTHILKLRAQDPQKYKDIKTSQEIDALVKQKAKDSSVAQAKATAGASGIGSFMGQLGGGLAAGFTDPVNLATIPFGAGLAGGVIRAGLIDAGINMGAEAINYPFVKRWQKELGQEYGAGQFAENAGIAAVFGFGLGAGGKLLGKGLDKLGIPNSTKMAKMREFFDKNPEMVQALRHEERRLNIQEADPHTYNESIPPDVHQKALEEVDAAIGEERPVEASNIDVSDEQIKKMDTSKMDEFTKAAHQMLIEDPLPEREAKKGTNEIFDTPSPNEKPLETHDEITKLQDSPEVVAQEKTDFEAATKDLPDDHVIHGDRPEENMTLEEMRKSFDDDNEYLAAISSCGIGKS